MRRILLALCLLPSFNPNSFAAQNYSVTKQEIEGHTTYHLIDAARKMDVGIAPDIGNFAYQFKVNGKDVLIPPQSLREYLEKRWFCCGIPFLAPWANRIDQDYYFFEGKKYLLNAELGNLLRVPPDNLVLHGVLVFDTRWRVVESGASDSEGAFITSRIHYFKYPDLMAQFPFAQTYEITYRLKDGKLENTTRVFNHSKSDLPVHFGYHPYFRPDGPREEWEVSIGARDHWKVDSHERLIPTGETEPAGAYLPHNEDFKLGRTFIDDAFSNLVRDADGLGHYWVKGRTQTVEVIFDKKYDFGHVYAPVDNTLICFEPETGPTNAFNLNHQGKFPDLIVVKPDGKFEVSFWIVPRGF